MARSLAQWAMQNTVLATVYERLWRPALGYTLMGLDLDHVRHEKDLTIRALRLVPGSTVVDVACGPGNFTAAFAEAVGREGHAIGVDLSPPMLGRAVRDNAASGASYVLGDASRLPFEDGSLDAASCYAALYLIPRPFSVLDEMIRVVRPGGRLALMTSVESPRTWLRPAQARVLGLSGLHMFGRDDFTGRLRRAGFTEATHEVHGSAQYVAATAP